MTKNKATYLAAASALTLVISGYALADTKSQNEVRAEASATGSVEKDVKEAWKDMKHDAKEVSKQFEAYFLSDDEKIPVKKYSYATASSSSGMIGSPVMNYKGEKVGTVKDIIVNSSGEADMVVIADGEFPGFDGKLVAFNYSDISKKNKDGDIIAPISENLIDKTSEFSYSAGSGSSLVRYVPDGGYSVEKILKGDVFDSNNAKVGAVDDIYFKNGEADLIIIGFDKTLGMGGKKVAASYESANIVFDGDSLNAQLTKKQSVALANYKKAISQ